LAHIEAKDTSESESTPSVELSVVQLATPPFSSLKVNTLPIARVIALIPQQRDRNTLAVMVKELMTKPRANASMTKALVDAAPVPFNVVRNKIRDRFTLVPAAFTFKAMPLPSSNLLLLRKLYSAKPSDKTALASYNNSHYYGMPIPKDLYKYFNFLTDVVVPDEVTHLHIYNKDVKFAMILHHAYPNKKITYLSDDEHDMGLINTASRRVMKAQFAKVTRTYDTDRKSYVRTTVISDNIAKFMAIFPDLKVNLSTKGKADKSTPEKELTDLLLSFRNKEHDQASVVSNYKHYFRYVNVFGIPEKDDEREYYMRPSCSSRQLKVVATSGAQTITYAEAVADVLTSYYHWLHYSWYTIPYHDFTKHKVPLKPKYNVTLTLGRAQENMEGNRKFLEMLAHEDPSYKANLELFKETGLSSFVNESTSSTSTATVVQTPPNISEAPKLKYKPPAVESSSEDEGSGSDHEESQDDSEEERNEKWQAQMHRLAARKKKEKKSKERQQKLAAIASRVKDGGKKQKGKEKKGKKKKKEIESDDEDFSKEAEDIEDQSMLDSCLGFKT
jgi:hypothetical protein